MVLHNQVRMQKRGKMPQAIIEVARPQGITCPLSGTERLAFRKVLGGNVFLSCALNPLENNLCTGSLIRKEGNLNTKP